MNRSLLDFFKRVPSEKGKATSSTNSPVANEKSQQGNVQIFSEGTSSECDKSKKNEPVQLNKSSSNVKIGSNQSKKLKMKELESDEDDELVISQPKKRRRLIVSSDSEGESESPSIKPSARRKSCGDALHKASAPSTPPPNKIKERLSQYHGSSPITPSRGNKSQVSMMDMDEDEVSSSRVAPDEGDEENCEIAREDTKWDHLSLDFLYPKKIRDIRMRRPDHEDFDPTTLYVPDSFKSSLTPGMRQWWAIKERHFDTILFFKVGKFYELYHMDAVIAVNELGLVYMRGNYAHSGFPEVAYFRYAEQLVLKGYKVSRVEQTETADSMNERTRNRPTKEKVVRRDLCEIITPGVCLPSLRDRVQNTVGLLGRNGSEEIGESGAASDVNLSSNRRQARYLLAIRESPLAAISGLATAQDNLLGLNSSFNQSMDGVSQLQPNLGKISVAWERTYSVAFFCGADGEIYLGDFQDDRHSSRFRTLLTHYPPAQILYSKKNLSGYTMSLLNQSCASVCKENLTFWSAEKTLQALAEGKYYVDKEGRTQWPEAVRKFLSESDSLGLTADPQHVDAVQCLGALVQYLKQCLVDDVVLSMRSYHVYSPADVVEHRKKEDTEPFYEIQHRLVLDSITLSNLDVLINDNTGTVHGTLLERLDTCKTPFGKRKLRELLAAPPSHPLKIQERQDAITIILSLHPSKLEPCRNLLKRLPDLEKLLVKIHAIGFRDPSTSHPDNNAVLYEMSTYSRRQIEDFVTTIQGFHMAHDCAVEIQSLGFENSLIQRLVNFKEGMSSGKEGEFPNMKNVIRHFEEAFDHEKAKKEGKIIPEPGVDGEYDAAIEEIERITKEANDYLKKESSRLGCKLTYFGTARNRYQLEVPESVKVSSQYALSSQRKGFRRYRTEECDLFLKEMMSAEDKLDSALKNMMRRLFYKFASYFSSWKTIVGNLASVDCLFSLADYSRNLQEPSCRPEVLPLLDSTSTHGGELRKGQLDIIDGRHPLVTETFFGCEFIPNDMHLGGNNVDGQEATVSLITGPNMGGKSTLMRQTALIVILAHMGCYVPARSCSFTPVDRIFTRLGASDRILSGESTFLVEMAETSCILQYATRDSLVLLDELGRGTSTYDGTALASGVLHYLAYSPRLFGSCRVLFSTHYHSLLDYIESGKGLKNKLPNVMKGQKHFCPIKLGHMACLLEEEEACDVDSTEEISKTREKITFLYKFVPGVCPKSYGFNAARLAHLPEKVILRGQDKAKELEEETLLLSLFRDLVLNQVTGVELASRQQAIRNL